MRLSANDHLGAYQITRALGKGGMGEVYQATDPRLDRDVAIKIIPERHAGNPDALKRFEREAKALAALESPTQNSQAYQFYLKGRYLWNKRTIEDIKKSIPYFDQAIDVDPNYALAYSGLSDSYNAFWSYGVSGAHEALPKAKAAASRALSLDDNLAEAHASLALYLMDYEYDRAGAVREFKRAIELNPNYAYAHQGYAQLLHSTGRFEESLAEARRAADLDPLSRISNNVVARVLFYARRNDEAIAQFRRNINFDPNWMLDRYYLYQAYAAKGMYAEAIAEFNVFQALYGEPASEIQATRERFAKSGWNGFFKHRVEHLEAKSKREYVRAYDIAILYSPIGDTDKAIVWLEKAYQEREYGMSDLNAPWFDKIRSDPRFEELLRRVRLQQ